MAINAELKKRFLEFLKSDEEFRLAVAGLLGLDTVISELKRLREDFLTFVKVQEKRWEENNRRWEDAYKRFEAIESEIKRLWEAVEKLREDFNKLREDFNKLYESVMKRMDSFERRLMALGTRWGIESEGAFRNAMRGVVEELLGVAKVEKWRCYDERGEVLGYPSWIEVDVTIKDQIHVLLEVKSSASGAEVSKLWRIGKLYERVVGVRPRLVLVTPFIDESGLEAAEKLGVEVYTKT
ncbi:MAG: DUF3782 domain-containing protein [Desulfurococcaceae archaeon]|nr:DUF3782 domain-containing protein [Desulfurococcaceae archaeon]